MKENIDINVKVTRYAVKGNDVIFLGTGKNMITDFGLEYIAQKGLRSFVKCKAGTGLSANKVSSGIITATVTNGVLTATSSIFTNDMAGRLLCLADGSQFKILTVTDSQTVTIDATQDILTPQFFAVWFTDQTDLEQPVSETETKLSSCFVSRIGKVLNIHNEFIFPKETIPQTYSEIGYCDVVHLASTDLIGRHVFAGDIVPEGYSYKVVLDHEITFLHTELIRDFTTPAGQTITATFYSTDDGFGTMTADGTISLTQSQAWVNGLTYAYHAMQVNGSGGWTALQTDDLQAMPTSAGTYIYNPSYTLNREITVEDTAVKSALVVILPATSAVTGINKLSFGDRRYSVDFGVIFSETWDKVTDYEIEFKIERVFKRNLTV